METNRKKALEELYQLLQETDWMQGAEGASEFLVQELSGMMIQDKELERDVLKDKLYELLFHARKSGFLLGFRYAVRLLMECCS